MLKRLRRLPSPALVISAIALIVAVGGGSFALAISDSKSDKKIAKRVSNKQITKRAPNLSVNHAQTADTAGDAQTLDGKPGSHYSDKCPSGYTHAAHADLCFEFNVRSPATYPDALQICAGNGGHLPSLGELAVAFDNLSPFQGSQWAGSLFFGNTGAAAVTMRQTSTRQILFSADLTTTTNPYRCVSSPSN